MNGSSVMMNPCAEDFSGMTVTHEAKQIERAIRKLLYFFMFLVKERIKIHFIRTFYICLSLLQI